MIIYLISASLYTHIVRSSFWRSWHGTKETAYWCTLPKQGQGSLGINLVGNKRKGRHTDTQKDFMAAIILIHYVRHILMFIIFRKSLCEESGEKVFLDLMCRV